MNSRRLAQRKITSVQEQRAWKRFHLFTKILEGISMSLVVLLFVLFVVVVM